MLHKPPTLVRGEKPLPPAVARRIDWIVDMDRAVREFVTAGDTGGLMQLAAEYTAHNMTRTARMISILAESETK